MPPSVSARGSSPALRVRRARALVVTWEHGGLQIANFLQKQSFTCNTAGLELLSALTEWTPADRLFALLDGFSPRSVASEIARLIAVGALVVEGSDAARLDSAYAEQWEWGVVAGLYHFGIRDTRFLGHEQTVRHIATRARTAPAPINYATNDGSRTRYRLPPMDPAHPVFRTMKRRRTVRGLRKRAVSQAQIGDCLYAGLGIVGFYQDRLLGRMPVKMTPSGGARNPYEAYVYALNIAGVDKGFYHYSALEHTLQRVSGTRLPRPGALLSGQHYANKASAIIFLVANFRRTMWKYQHPTAYRVVVLEAGHIGQNIAIAAARHGLTANPTAAIQDTLIEQALGVAPPMQAVMYALTVGHPDPRYVPTFRRAGRDGQAGRAGR